MIIKVSNAPDKCDNPKVVIYICSLELFFFLSGLVQIAFQVFFCFLFVRCHGQGLFLPKVHANQSKCHGETGQLNDDWEKGAFNHHGQGSAGPAANDEGNHETEKAGGAGAGKVNRSAGMPVFGVPVDFWLDKRGGLWYTAILYEYVAR